MANKLTFVAVEVSRDVDTFTPHHHNFVACKQSTRIATKDELKKKKKKVEIYNFYTYDSLGINRFLKRQFNSSYGWTGSKKKKKNIVALLHVTLHVVTIATIKQGAEEKKYNILTTMNS